MKRVLSVFILCALIVGTLVFVAPSINSGQAFAQTTVRTRYRRHKRTFWQKHRDKLTLAGSTAAGAAIASADDKLRRPRRGLLLRGIIETRRAVAVFGFLPRAHHDVAPCAAAQDAGGARACRWR